ncbi:hypothetical protein [Streptacidiphilus rugosus]|uniref:hypothetical protein n=1 Tax=Streptacidiphilus rugosus TaxID=405783 RepID=UPI0012F7A782|nr:hypothetical protein [Streptacidiphilus rugosus]
MLTALLFLPLSGCGSDSPSTDAMPVGHELALLKSSRNGLYYQPFLRDEPAGPEDNSYAALIRAEIADGVQMHPNAKRSAFFRSEAISVSPLVGRAWLAPLVAAGAKGLLDSTDTDAVRKLRSPQGWFTDPGTKPGDDTVTSRVAGTVAALQVLQAIGGLTPADRAATLPWLKSVAGTESGLDGTSAEVAIGLRLLGGTVPERLMAAKAPAVGDFTSLTGPQRYQALVGSYAYVVIHRESVSGTVAGLSAAVWTEVLEHNADTLSYPDLYSAVVVAHAAGAGPSAFDPVRSRLSADVLPDGSVRDPSAYIGDSEASLYSLLLRGLAGEKTADPSLAQALATAEGDPHVAADPVAKLVTDTARVLAGDKKASADASADCRTTGVIPRSVTVDNIEEWTRLTRACQAAGVHLAAPGAAPWGLADVQHAVAAATLVTGLSDGGTTHGLPAWVSGTALLPWAEHPERFPSARSYATVVQAYLLVTGGHMDPALRGTVKRFIDPRRGCDDFPDLYQADSVDGCDLVTTWTVWRLELALDGKLPLATNHPTPN